MEDQSSINSNGSQINQAFEHGEHGSICDDPGEDGCEDTSQDGTAVQEKQSKSHLGLIYRVDEKPGWHICVVLGIQHCLLSIGGLIGLPLLMAPMLCMTDTDEGYLGRALVLSTLFFVSGIVSFLQTTFGTRLPIMQGSSFSFLPPALAILALPHNKCPSGPISTNITNGSYMYNDTDGAIIDGNELWQRRMREVQGAIAVASIVEFVLAVTGTIGFLMRFVGPLTVAPAITLIGLALFDAAAYNASGQWGIAMFTTIVLIICSQYLANVQVPLPIYSKSKGCRTVQTNIFKLFPVLITMVLSCTLCVILTVTGVLPNEPGAPGYRGRIDVRLNVLHSSPWFRIPYPLQWGPLKVSSAGVVGMIAGVLAGIIESIGDYYACARLTGAPPLPKHALNRGLAVEGFGCILAGLFGTGSGTTSFSENIGAIGITRVGSRRVLQVAGVVFFLLGMFGKVGAVMVLIPDPVIGGMFCTMFGMIAAVGLSNLQYVDLNSSRNLFVLGFSLFMGITIPIWVKDNPDAIDTGVEALDQILRVLLETSMFIGGFLGALLDNTVPGTREERGLLSWSKDDLNNDVINMEDKENFEKRIAACYDLPFSTNFKLAKYIPILPQFGKKEGAIVSLPE